jgi:hypothetical protein
VHLQLAPVRLGQLPERIAVSGPGLPHQVGGHQLQSSVTFSRIRIFPPGTDTGQDANWAVATRPLSRRRGVCITDP